LERETKMKVVETRSLGSNEMMLDVDGG
jgi:hypothetical protein